MENIPLIKPKPKAIPIKPKFLDFVSSVLKSAIADCAIDILPSVNPSTILPFPSIETLYSKSLAGTELC